MERTEVQTHQQLRLLLAFRQTSRGPFSSSLTEAYRPDPFQSHDLLSILLSLCSRLCVVLPCLLDAEWSFIPYGLSERMTVRYSFKDENIPKGASIRFLDWLGRRRCGVLPGWHPEK